MTQTAGIPTLAPAEVLPRRASWAGAVSLGFGTFALVTSEFLPASLLSPMAADVGVSLGVAGQTVTATALLGAITGPTLAPLLPRLDRRLLIVGLVALSIVSNVLGAFAVNFGMLLVARLLLGIAVAGFWSLAIAVISAILPAHAIGRGMTIVNLGVSLATVLAIPVGAFLGDLVGWRAVFLIAAAAGAVALTLQLLLLPSVAPATSGGVRTILDTARRPIVAGTIVAIFLLAGGHFMGFTYIRPVIEATPEGTAATVALVLLVYGIATIVGTTLVGFLVDWRLRAAAITVPVLIAVGAIGAALLSSTLAGLLVAVFVWGLGFGGLPTVANTWLSRVAPDRLESVGGLAVFSFQTAIAVGSMLGGVIVDSLAASLTLVLGGAAVILGGIVLSSMKPAPAVRG